MSGRKKLSEGSYFASNESGLSFISSGCTLLDCVLGGGWVLGRVGNLVGDKSTGKTLLAIEACANFVRTYKDGVIKYCEAEAAFDKSYAEQLGLPVKSVEFSSNNVTVEDLFDDLEKTLDSLKGKPCLYIVDSLDALSDKAEQERGISDGSYGAAKAKKMGELFRRLVKKMESSRMCLLIISQIRDKIGVTFGETKMRTGGRSLDFYSSQVVWLADTGKIKKTINKQERVVGVTVVAKNKKNKIGLPYRDCEFPIIFGYGVDDLTAMSEWILKVKGSEGLSQFNLSEGRHKTSISKIRDIGGKEFSELSSKMKEYVISTWNSIETEFLPKSRKYDD